MSGVDNVRGIPHDVGQLTGSYVALPGQQAPAAMRRSNTLALVIGILGLVLAAGAILLYFFAPRTTVVTVTHPPGPQSTAPAPGDGGAHGPDGGVGR
jgi:hypothetical protein